MDKENWQKIKSVFEVISGLSGQEREEFLKKEYGDDPELRQEVRKLLNSFDEAGASFLEELAEKEVVSQIFEQKTRAMNATTGEVSTANFVAGTVLDNRYRIIGLLGKGGMGEVYKAEDLTLNQTVALKFLPDKLAKNEDALKRFIGEVKTARQVAHENVCKVFDIGEINGHRYLSMEYIDGDDLSHLLNRIGRLPSDKAVEISRQICFGLHAIHKTGILHRDLKPANIIIDGQGTAKITDFGIAGFEDGFDEKEVRVGTPAYMSPEQIVGKEVTQKSDIYSLGLLLYEIFTGKQAFEGTSLNKLIEKQKTATPKNPSTIVETIDPLIEKIIERCLAKNPAQRPASAIEVALSLPGGNPLEAAIAAGETPSPEMVAATPKKGMLKPARAIGFLLAFILSFFLAIALNQDYAVFALISFEKSPEVLAEKSREIVQKVGDGKKPVDTEYKFIRTNTFLNYHGFVRNEDTVDFPSRKEMLKTGRALTYHFLYRQSPQYLEPLDGVSVTADDPPPTIAGMIDIKLDPFGRLFEFVSNPTQTKLSESEKKADWKKFFEEAGLDIGQFKETESKRLPPVPADKTRVWQGAYPEFPNIPVQIETAEYKGSPVYFRIFHPWDRRDENEVGNQFFSERLLTFLIFTLLSVTLIGAFILAYRNLKAGRGDLRGGLKLTLFVFALAFLAKLAVADHIPVFSGEYAIIYEAFGDAVIISIRIGLFYIALEPFIRRNWSEMLISWTRIMTGDFRDPMVGRDILIGGVFGLFQALTFHLGVFLTEGFTENRDIVETIIVTETLNGINGWGAVALNEIVSNLLIGFLWLFLAYLFYRLTGKKFLGVLSVGAITLVFQGLYFFYSFHWLLIVGVFLSSVFLVFVLRRYGLLGVISYNFFFHFLWNFPVTFDSSQFYFSTSLLTILVILAIIVYAFYISIAGQRVFSRNWLRKIED